MATDRCEPRIAAKTIPELRGLATIVVTLVIHGKVRKRGTSGVSEDFQDPGYYGRLERLRFESRYIREEIFVRS